MTVCHGTPFGFEKISASGGNRMGPLDQHAGNYSTEVSELHKQIDKQSRWTKCQNTVDSRYLEDEGTL